MEQVYYSFAVDKLDDRELSELLRYLNLCYLAPGARAISELARVVGCVYLLLALAAVSKQITEQYAKKHFSRIIRLDFLNLQRSKDQVASTLMLTWEMKLVYEFENYGTSAEHKRLCALIHDGKFALTKSDAEAERFEGIFNIVLEAAKNLRLTNTTRQLCDLAGFLVADEFTMMAQSWHRMPFSVVEIFAKLWKTSQRVPDAHRVRFLYADGTLVGIVGLECVQRGLFRLIFAVRQNVAKSLYRHVFEMLRSVSGQCIYGSRTRNARGFVVAGELGFVPCGIYQLDRMSFVELLYDPYRAEEIANGLTYAVEQELTRFAAHTRVPRIDVSKDVTGVQIVVLGLCIAFIVAVVIMAFRDPYFAHRLLERRH